MMIKDKLNRHVLYKENTSLDIIFNFIHTNDLKNISTGLGIINEKIHYIISEYNTHEYSNDLWEKHNKNIDVQYIIKGAEMILISTEFLRIGTPYDEERDIAFYTSQEPYDRLILNEDEFILIFPHEIHQPCVSIIKDSYVKKIVFKINSLI